MESREEDGGVVLLIEADAPVHLCRICHEEEEGGTSNMETPCACSGTLKFAHRGCVQRWCDEKGSTICEICLQKFEPGYRASPKKALVDIGVTIRESLEVLRQDHDHSSSDEDDNSIDYAPECSPPTSRNASLCRLVVVVFTISLLIKHLIDVVSLDTDHQTFTPLTVFLLRAVGILLPSLAVMQTISAIQKMQERHQRRRTATSANPPSSLGIGRDNDTQQVREDQLHLESIQTQ